MLTPTDPEQIAAIRDMVHTAAGRPEVTERLTGIYEGLAAEIAERRPVCIVSGRCCRFEEFGHRLFVTTLELAAFVRGLNELPPDQRARLSQSAAAWDGTGCPFQIAKLCGVHGIRPFGCRIYFCDATAQEWQQDVYERLHATIKSAHQTLDVPYLYLEWRAALRIVLDQAAGS